MAGRLALREKGRRSGAGLFDNLDAEIDDVPAAEVLEVLQRRLKMPFLFDHNAMVRNRIDCRRSSKSRFPASEATTTEYYNRCSSRRGLQSELRVDEAGKPLFWITTVKK